MITRFPGLTPTRSRAVVHNGLVFTVAVPSRQSIQYLSSVED